MLETIACLKSRYFKWVEMSAPDHQVYLVAFQWKVSNFDKIRIFFTHLLIFPLLSFLFQFDIFGLGLGVCWGFPACHECQVGWGAWLGWGGLWFCRHCFCFCFFTANSQGIRRKAKVNGWEVAWLLEKASAGAQLPLLTREPLGTVLQRKNASAEKSSILGWNSAKR